MKSGNSLSSDCFVLPTRLEWMLRGKYLCWSREAIFRSHSYFGFHCSEFFPWGPRSYLCTTPDDFSLFFSVFFVPELPASQHTPHTSVHPLNKCVSSLATVLDILCWPYVGDQKVYFGLVSRFRNLFVLITSTSPLVGWTILSPQESLFKNIRKVTLLMRIECVTPVSQ